tara:strand:- start:368 stop:676 length:309 start_codon:yes stop_codon:yes gene_type:complete
MATTFTWKIAELERETSDGYVYTAHWTVSATDGTYRAGAYGSEALDRPDTLVPFADLTETQVIGWVKDKLTADKVTQIETALDNQISEQKTPTKATGKPWSG